MNYSETIADGTILGDVPGIGPGMLFRDRQELHEKKLHRGLMRGIAPHGSQSFFRAATWMMRILATS